MLKHLDQRRRDDEGFTLIELMVVVLILGILMAIAIPTFLSTTKSANGVAAESNATNAATSEISYYSTNSTFLSGSAGSTLDPALPWITSGSTPANGQVLVLTTTALGGTWVDTNTSATTGEKVMLLVSQAKDGECYLVFDDQASNVPVVGYAAEASGSAGCGTIAATAFATDPTITAGNAASNKAANNTAVASLTWYPSF